MGSMIQAICKCGFQSECICAGGGFLNFVHTCTAPALCIYCNILVEKNYLKKFSKCPRCRKKVVFYDDESLRDSVESSNVVFSWRIDDEKGEFVLPDVNYLCPECGEKAMRFVHAGCWD